MTPTDDEWVAPVVSLFGTDRERPVRARVPRSSAAGERPPVRIGESADGPAEHTGAGHEDAGAAAPIFGSAGESPAERRAAALAALSAAEQAAARTEKDPSEPPRDRAAEKAARRATNVSIAALTRRGMSEAELRDRLRDREIDDDAIEAEIERLRSGHYLDDAALAESVVRTESERKGRGRSAIAAELRRRRIDQTAIESALESIDDADERERAREVAEKRVRQMPGQPPEVVRRRLAGFLQRRGYSGSVLQYAMEAALRSGPGFRSGPADRVRFVTADDDED